MDPQINYYLRAFIKNSSGASEKSIEQLQSAITFELPAEYISLMKEFNGGEGEIGENSWLTLFPVEDLVLIQKDYDLLLRQVPDYFLFGKDAADTGYAFHKINQTFHSFGLMSNFEKDAIENCGNTFNNFMEYLYNE